MFNNEQAESDYCLMTLTGDRGSPIVRGQWTSPRHKNREGETQASGVADTADESEARSKRFILYICRPQMHAFHRSIRLRWSHKSTLSGIASAVTRRQAF